MMNETLKESFSCSVCSSQYCKETGDPKILKCGHILCSTCLQKMILNSSNKMIECVECRTSIDVDSAERAPVVYAIKQILAKIEEEKNDTFNKNIVIYSNDETQNEKFDIDSLGTCHIHSSPLHFGCINCEEWLCGTCVCLNHSSREKSCKVYFIKEAIENKREEVLKLLTKKQNCIKGYVKDNQITLQSTKTLISQAENSIAIQEKYLKELQSQHSEFTKEDQDLKLCEDVVNELSHKLKEAEIHSEQKNILENYFLKKSLVNFKKKRTNLFDTWKHYMQDTSEEFNLINCVYETWEDHKGEKYWIKLKVKNNEVIMNLSRRHKSLEKEKFFYDFYYSRNLHHPFIEVSDKDGNVYEKKTFLLDDNPLAQEFMKRCCLEESEHSFKNRSFRAHSDENNIFIFGSETECKYDSIEIDENDYKKPIFEGAIGLYNGAGMNGKIDIHNMVIYIHMSTEHDTLNAPPISLEDGKYYLNFCFGRVYKGFDEDYFDFDKEHFISDCGVIVEEMSDEEDD